MIDKQDFYHGAALVPLLAHSRFGSIRRIKTGYVVNQSTLAVVKYTTKHRSPWRYTFGVEELELISLSAARYSGCVLAFVNGGDGVSAITFDELNFLLGRRPGWVSMKRRFNEMYAVSGQADSLRNKVSLNRWPSLALTRDGTNPD